MRAVLILLAWVAAVALICRFVSQATKKQPPYDPDRFYRG